jgi:hypothetical protein
MKHEIIYTDDCALIVIELTSPGKEGQVFLTKENIIHTVVGWNYGDRVIIGHRPFTDAAILEGVPLLPEFGQEEDVKKISEKQFYLEMESPLFEELGVTKKVQKAILIGMLQGTFTRGYNKAKETYKYTEEDIQKAFIAGEERIINKPNSSELDDFTIFIQSLQQPKRPKYFECEMEDYGQFDCDVFMKDGEEPKTITNSQGQTVLVGKYI